MFIHIANFSKPQSEVGMGRRIQAALCCDVILALALAAIIILGDHYKFLSHHCLCGFIGAMAAYSVTILTGSISIYLDARAKLEKLSG